MSLWKSLWQLIGFDGEAFTDRFELEPTVEPARRGRSDAAGDVLGQAVRIGEDEPIPPDLKDIRRRLEQIFRLPRNKDVVLREFIIAPPSTTASTSPAEGAGQPNREPQAAGSSAPGRRRLRVRRRGSDVAPDRSAAERGADTRCAAGRQALAVHLEGISDRDTIDFAVLQPLMYLAEGQLHAGHQGDDEVDILDRLYRRLVPANQATIARRMSQVVRAVVRGETAIFVDGAPGALLVETKGWEKRSVDQPTSEMVVRGPQEAFNETLRTNTAMIRRRLLVPELVTEMVTVGVRSRVDVAVMYLDSVANPELVREVRRRLDGIRADYIADSAIVEHFIEDDPSHPYPQVLSTERPDRTAAFLSEGHVAILVANSPYAIVVPGTFVGLLQTAEDMYVRWPYGGFLRVLRLTGYLIGVLLPGVYVAMTNFHLAMIPTDLMLAIAASREKVPFPVPVETFILLLAFELLSEAGVRIPGVLGPTIGIVGALILGQAAVQASIVSPILVVVIAITALSSFVVPNANLAMAIRLQRFVYFVAGSALGFFGISVVFTVMAAKLVSTLSFGVPYLSPVAPTRSGPGDVVWRDFYFRMEQRPSFVRPLDPIRQARYTRRWRRGGGQ